MPKIDLLQHVQYVGFLIVCFCSLTNFILTRFVSIKEKKADVKKIVSVRSSVYFYQFLVFWPMGALSTHIHSYF